MRKRPRRSTQPVRKKLFPNTGGLQGSTFSEHRTGPILFRIRGPPLLRAHRRTVFHRWIPDSTAPERLDRPFGRGPRCDESAQSRFMDCWSVVSAGEPGSTSIFRIGVTSARRRKEVSLGFLRLPGP